MNSEPITQRIWQHSKMTGVNKLILLALAQHADSDGFCWPGYAALGEMVGLTGKPQSIERNAMRNLGSAIAAGEVKVWKQQGQKGGRGYTNVYLITVGLSPDEIQEIENRRIGEKRVSTETLLKTREIKKGDTFITLNQEKGDKIDTLNQDNGDKNDTQDQPETEKGDKNDTRTIEESLKDSNFKYESSDIQDSKDSTKVGCKPIKRREKGEVKENSIKKESQAMFSALANLCGYDIGLLTNELRGALNQAEKRMRERGYTPADVVDFGEWWKDHDWRGKKGQCPDLSLIRKMWGQFKQWQRERIPTQDNPVSITPVLPVSPEQSLWDMALSDIRGSVTQAIFDQLIKPLRPIEGSNGTYLLSAPAEIDPRRIEDRLGGTILRVLKQLKPDIQKLKVIPALMREDSTITAVDVRVR